jgi:Effector Associated Constant Component 1
MGSPFIISFPGSSTAEANRFASGLATAIREAERDVSVEQKRDRPDSQDAGATLVLVLGTAAATAVAKGVEAWLARHSGAKIQISKDGSVIASNLDSRDAARIAEAFKPRK